MYKKDCAISLPTGFIFVHCRLVSQCNAPPITSHSFAPTPHPSRPSAHAPNTLWRQLLLIEGGGPILPPTEYFLPPPFPAPSCLCWLPSPRFISSTGYHSPEPLNLPRSLACFFLVRSCDASGKCYSNRVLKKCYRSVTPPPPHSCSSSLSLLLSLFSSLYITLHLLLFPLLTSPL